MMHDPTYMMLSLVGMALVFLPQLWVKSTVAKYREVPIRSQLTGADLAQEILRHNGISHVAVQAIEGELTDHYDPGAKAVRLSADNYYGRSVTALAIAAHECGHAIQHDKGYVPVVIRGAMWPLVGLGSQLGPLLLMIGIGMGAAQAAGPSLSALIAWVGVGAFAASVAFHLVTLPVEFDASGRALAILSNNGYLSSDEMPGAKKVLTAAAMTYVATALYSLMELVYWVFRLMGSRNRD
ncbi:MAG: zinc metallopeptidase [Vampirovibrionales bacterium]